MINLEALIGEVRAALDRDPGADVTLIKTATLLCVLDVLTPMINDTKWFFCTTHGGVIAVEDAEPDCTLVGPYARRDEAEGFRYE